MENQSWLSWGSLFATFTFIVAMARDYFPYSIRRYLMKTWQKAVEVLYPYVDIRIDELSGEWLRYSLAYASIETYLTHTSSTRARKLKGRMDKDSHNLILSMDEYEEVTDDYQGVTVWWTSCKSMNRSQSFSFYPSPDEKRFYILTFHKQHRKLIVDSYMKHVMEEAKVIEARNRRRKLYTNNPNRDNYSYRKKMWTHVPFEHPATFQTVAMDSDKKKRIIKDLDFFKNSKDYYRRIGKAWKRGYLLYGPPGTGKSTMIAAMANYMDYDVYDLELTSVKDNTELRQLLIETTSKSIIVIEDIDCSLDLTGSRKKKKESKEEEELEKEKAAREGLPKGKDESRVTLSGLLNFIDGLWSACGGERLIVFTTNHIEKLDPALIRTGRMDKHIEMSYCSYEGFKVLAKNYLEMDSHELFGEVRNLFEVDQVQVAPADVAERLMPATGDEKEEESGTICLQILIDFMEKTKVEKLKKEKGGEGEGWENTEEEDGAPVIKSDCKKDDKED